MLGAAVGSSPAAQAQPAGGSVALEQGDQVTAWGSNASGQNDVPASLTGKTVTDISGSYHSLALTSDGKVTAWGKDDDGQATVPDSLTGSTVTAVVAGGRHSLALTSDGTVTAWGNNTYGQSDVPNSLTGKTVTAITAGAYHSVALTSDGKVTAWGYNYPGQPDVPDSLDGKVVTLIAAGPYHSLALTSEGEIIGWGNIGDGQADAPESLSGKTVTALAAGLHHSLALTSDGVVTAWGDEGLGEIDPPASLTGKTVTAIAAGWYHSLALTSEGQVTGWGAEFYGETDVPDSLAGRRVTTIAAAIFHSLAVSSVFAADAAPAIGGVPQVGGALTAVPGTYSIAPDGFDFAWEVDGTPVGTDTATYRPTRSDVDKTVTVTVTAHRDGYPDVVTTSAPTGPVSGGGQVTAWGSDFFGQTTVPDSLTGRTVTTVAAGESHSLAVTADGQVTAWGEDGGGLTTVPPSLAGRTTVAVAAGTDHSLALTADGQVTGWGDDGGGQATVPPGLAAKTVVAIAAGARHSLALTVDGQVAVWGANNFGQTAVPPSLAEQSVVAIAAGAYHSLALTADGKVTAWGWNLFGEATVPPALTGKIVTAIATGERHSMALTADGEVIAWGFDQFGQATVPPGLAGKDVTAIAAGAFHSLALTADGHVTAWGVNSSGQNNVPVGLAGKNVTAIAAGTYHSMALSAALNADGVPTIAGDARVGQELSVTVPGNNADPDAVTFQWYADGAAISDATSDTLTLSAAQLGTHVTVTVTATKDGYTLTSTTSEPTEPVVAGSFTTGPEAGISGTAQVGQTLTATTGTPDPAADSFAYQWFADGEAVYGATGESLKLTPLLVGTSVKVEVTATRTGYADASDPSEAVGPVAAGAFTTGPTAGVTGTAQVGRTLTATTGTTVPAAGSFSYQWFAGGQPIDGATGDSLELTPALAGTSVTVEVTATRVGYADASDTSEAVGPVTAGEFTTGPTADITGSAVVGGTLTAVTGTTSPAADSFSYRWLADGDPVPGETGAELEVTAAMVGKIVRVEVTAIRTGYVDAVDLSATVAVIGRAQFATGPTAGITGTAQVGRTLTATTGTPEPAAESFRYAWSADGVPVFGAEGATFTLSAAQLGAVITVRVTALRAGYVDSADDSDPTAPVVSGGFTTGPSASVNGTAQVGQTLTAGTGAPVPDPDAYTFAWYADDTRVPGAEAPELVLTPAYRGRRISVQVTASRAGYEDASSRSAPTVPVVTDSAPGLSLVISVPTTGQYGDTGVTPDGDPTARRGARITIAWTSDRAQALRANASLTEAIAAKYAGRAIPASGRVSVLLERVGWHRYGLQATNEAGTTTATAGIVAVRRPTRLHVEAPTRARAGRAVRIRVTGLGFLERFYVTVEGDRVRLGQANKAGGFIRRIVIPATTRPGMARIRVTGRSTHRTGAATVRVR
nr:hypothetical protein [Nocardioides lijunqiniae]